MTKKQEKERVRLLFENQCEKLTARGVGLLHYQLGCGVSSEEPYIRISGNETSGTCSFEWIRLETIETLLNERPEPDKPFNAKLFQKAFISRSVNNHGYLAAMLKSESVITSTIEAPTLLSTLSFSSIKDRISTLAKEGVDLPDQIALKQAEKEKQRTEQSKSIKQQKTQTKTSPAKIDIVDDNPESNEQLGRTLPKKKDSEPKQVRSRKTV